MTNSYLTCTSTRSPPMVRRCHPSTSSRSRSVHGAVTPTLNSRKPSRGPRSLLTPVRRPNQKCRQSCSRHHCGHGVPVTELAPTQAQLDAVAAVAMPAYVVDDFAVVYAQHYRRLVVALCLSGAPLATAEEIAQEAFLRAFSSWHRVRTGSNPAGYLYRYAFRIWQPNKAPRSAINHGGATDDRSAVIPVRKLRLESRCSEHSPLCRRERGVAPYSHCTAASTPQTSLASFASNPRPCASTSTTPVSRYGPLSRTNPSSRPISSEPSAPGTSSAQPESMVKSRGMEPSDNSEVIGRLHRALFESADLDAVVDAFFAPSFVSHNTPPGLPSGIQGVKAFFAMFRDGLSDIEVTVDQIISQNDAVAVATTTCGTHTGP